MTAIDRKIGGPHCRGRGLLLTVAGAAMIASFPLCTSASAAVLDNPTTLGNTPALGDGPTLGTAAAALNSGGALDNPPSAGARADYLLADVMPVSDAELSKNRGGFSIGDLNVSFGFSVKTAIRGPDIHPFTVTNNFTVDHPGHVRHLGSQVSYDNSGDSQNSQTNGLSVTVASNTPNNSNPITTPPENNNSSPSTDHVVLTSNTVNQPSPTTTPTTTPTSAPTMHTTHTTPSTPPIVIHPTNSLVKTSSPGVQLSVDTSSGIVTKIQNTVNGMTFTSQVDLNYAVNNYHDIVSNARRFLRAANMADQMLAMHGMGH